jgi:hypothetical protein
MENGIIKISENSYNWYSLIQSPGQEVIIGKKL